MRLFGFEIARAQRERKAAVSEGWQLRPADGQGPYTKYFANYIPRKVEASFYEFLREGIPIIDAAITRLVSLDGHIIVTGENAALVDEIQEWFYNVPVNDVQRGIQAFHQSLTNEAFEQGFALGEFVTNRKRNDIEQLRTADSKFIKFKRTMDGLEMYQKGDNDPDWRPLQQDNLIYFSIHNENQNPYGVPLFRSCEFVAKVLATMHNSLLNVWERFGDPSFQIIYKTSKRDGADLTSRRKVLEDEFNTAIRAKREGKSADFVRAIDANSSIEIKVIGADGQLLEIEQPMRHVIEQIVAKSGLPSWTLGLHWSTTERLADTEVEVLLGDVATRQAAKMPHFYNLVRTLLLLRGRTWKKGDWRLEWAQVNLRDVLKQAQARFMNAQADMYEGQIRGGESGKRGVGEAGKRGNGDGGKRLTTHDSRFTTHDSRFTIHGHKETQRPTAWPELDKVETEYTAQLKADWAKLEERVLTILKLTTAATAGSAIDMGHGASSSDVPCQWLTPGLKDDALSLTPEQRSLIMQALKKFYGVYDPEDNPESYVKWYYAQSYSLGLIQAASMAGYETPILDIIKNSEVYDELCATGFDLVKQNATQAIVGEILPEMEAQVIAGTNPIGVAARLKELFGDQNDDWERLARTEMTMAAEKAKLDEWKEWGLKEAEYVPAPDGCPICQSLAGKYPIDKCPVPGRDTHPRCRCSIRPVASKRAGETGNRRGGEGGDRLKLDMTRDDWLRAWKEDPHWAASTEPSPLAKSMVEQDKENTAKSSILEIGCGNGRDSIYFGRQGYTATGIDISPDAVEIAKKNNTLKNVSFEVGDAESLRFANEQFSAVYSLSVLHSTDLTKSIKEASRVLVKGGLALLYLYIKSAYRNEESEEPASTEINFKVSEIEKLFKENKLKVRDKYRFEAEDEDENGTHLHSVVVYTLQKRKD